MAPGEKKSVLQALGGRPMILGAVAAAAVFALTLLPLRKEEPGRTDPATDAQTAYLSLLDRIGSSEAGPLGEATAAGMGPEAPAVRLDRDLFAPARRGSYHAPDAEKASAPSPRRPARSRAPSLSAIWIDGRFRQAILDGVPASEGDTVNGYVVTRIERSGVTLERKGAETRLPWGEES